MTAAVVWWFQQDHPNASGVYPPHWRTRATLRDQTLTSTRDAEFRLLAETDALGQVTTLEHSDPAGPLKITAVEDPFGKRATLTYTRVLAL